MNKEKRTYYLSLILGVLVLISATISLTYKDYIWAAIGFILGILALIVFYKGIILENEKEVEHEKNNI